MLVRDLVAAYRRAHNAMRNLDGLQPQEAFEELLKYLYYKQVSEGEGTTGCSVRHIRADFAKYLERHNFWSASLWRDREFHLSDQCLEECHKLFSEINFSAIGYDIRSAALREFLTADVRKGLGIYLTPDEVVREVVRFIDPRPTARCLDPACGSGTFLMELVKCWQSKKRTQCKVWGADKNPRMLLIAELNLGHLAGVLFSRRLMDSLVEPNPQHPEEWCRPGYFDFVLTNPPFGVSIETDRGQYSLFDTGHTESGLPRAKQASEWLFVEQSLKWLKPGGTLAIVLPKSVFTNPSSSLERTMIGKVGFLKAAMVLPPETFHVTGTQTNTVVAIIEKYRRPLDREKTNDVIVATLSNVGYDSTGRLKPGSQLEGLADRMTNHDREPVDYVSVISDVVGADSLAVLTAASSSKRSTSGGVPLGDLVQVIATGRTPPRAAYSGGKGLFLIKVGNLTGTGINWIARDRNFIDLESAGHKRYNPGHRVQSEDILLTSSAHSPLYIAKKVDIVTKVPSWVGGEASFVGEVMLVRSKKERASGFMLLGFLRQPWVIADIQRMVRGQTAHLHPDDVADLRIPQALLDASAEWKRVEAVLREEAALNERLNELAWQQQQLFARLLEVKSA